MAYTVLLVGRLDQKISAVAGWLLKNNEVDVRLLVSGKLRTNKSARTIIDPLLKCGAQVVHGDLSDPVSLDCATVGIDTIVYVDEGLCNLVATGRNSLLKAAQKNGVRNILLSHATLGVFWEPVAKAVRFQLADLVGSVPASRGVASRPTKSWDGTTGCDPAPDVPSVISRVASALVVEN